MAATIDLVRRIFGRILLRAAFAVCSVVSGAGAAGAVEVGQPAPNFTLASTLGSDISLSDFRGKKWVLLEFYAADFAPT
jgi:AhpC/TSA family